MSSRATSPVRGNIGTDGDDLFIGSDETETYYGLLGNDTYVFTSRLSRVVEAQNAGNDTILTDFSYVLPAGQEVETVQLLLATRNVPLDLTGNEFDNTLRGNNGANVLDGGVGADRLYGKQGDDTYRIDNPGDRVFEFKREGSDTLVASVSYKLEAGQEVETMRLDPALNTTKLSLEGNEFNQTIIGNDAVNKIGGGRGADILTGGKGGDFFLFTTKLGPGQVDHITDFEHSDNINLSKTVFSEIIDYQIYDRRQIPYYTFKDISAKGATIDADDRIIYDRGTGELSYDADGSGAIAPVLFAIIDNRAELFFNNFNIA